MVHLDMVMYPDAYIEKDTDVITNKYNHSLVRNLSLMGQVHSLTKDNEELKSIISQLTGEPYSEVDDVTE